MAESWENRLKAIWCGSSRGEAGLPASTWRVCSSSSAIAFAPAPLIAW